MTEEIKLDFSQWHPLDHWPGSARCRGFFGGWPHHLRIAWLYHRKWQLQSFLLRHSLCLIGRHTYRIWVMGGKYPFKPDATAKFIAVCFGCNKERPATKEEVAEQWQIEI